jgi:hypothetical protein
MVPMHNVLRRRPRQAFRQAPWRVEVRTTSRTLAVALALFVVGTMYLAVSAKQATAGREVLALEARRSELMHANDLLTARLADMTAPEVMRVRAVQLGFEPAGPDDIEYMAVEGFQHDPAFVAPRPPGTYAAGEVGLSPAYTETLGEWLSRWLQDPPTQP